MRKRLEYQGGIHQEDRMIKDKFRTFQKSLLYSYQAASVSLVQRHDECLRADRVERVEPIGSAARALINPDKIKQDYDDKIVSIDYKHGWGPGDVFEWRGTNSYWLIYLQELTEDSYFRGEIRRCKHKLKFKDKEGNWLYTWAAIRGPVETQIESIQKNQTRIDVPNLGLNILIPQNEKTLYAFDRYSEFIFAGRDWRVQAPDSISMTNIIEINAEEYYYNRDTDDVENEMKNGLIIEPVIPSPIGGIHGETFIKPKISEQYYVEVEGGVWSVDPCAPVRLRTIDATKIELVWDKATHGQFELQWSKDDTVIKKTIVVESLF